MQNHGQGPVKCAKDLGCKMPRYKINIARQILEFSIFVKSIGKSFSILQTNRFIVKCYKTL